MASYMPYVVSKDMVVRRSGAVNTAHSDQRLNHYF